MVADADTYKYWAPVDRDAPNNAHAFALQMIGRDKRVLELGCGAGHVTAALVEAGCSVVGIEHDAAAAEVAAQIAEEVLVVDLTRPHELTAALGDRRFDVVCCGDVLEHLPDPAGVLTVARRALRPGGTVVISLPNVAHIDVKLHLLQGRFDYRDNGLLDRTHLRFFTRDTIVGLLDEAGLELVELRRVVRPPFETELGVDPASVSPEVLQAGMADPEAQTYQFVLKAVPDDGGAEVHLAGRRLLELDAALAQERAERLAVEVDRAALAERLAQLEAHVATLEATIEHGRSVEAELAALRQTKTFRATAGFRRLYGALRRR